MVGQRQLAVVARMVEASIHPTAHIKRYILIAAAVVHPLSVLVLQLERLPAQVHLPKPFASADKALVGLTLKADCGPLRPVGRGTASAYKPQRQCIVPWRREVVVAQGNAFRLVTVRIEGDEWRRLWCWQKVAPMVELRCTEVNRRYLLPVAGDDIAIYITERQAFHSRRVL